ncbi:beta-lactamase/transpeptidase-like protein [Amylostereum chailletii]|nr:beta-lactamase/transpeptidase-like protein [Amylostereum chailletii]
MLPRLEWDTKIKDLLPEEWDPTDPWAKEMATLKDILTHISGLPRTDNTTSVLSKLRHLRSVFELREQWSYNNIMYMVAAHIVSKLSGLPFTSFVETRIFAPLGMNSVYSVDAASKTGRMCHAWSPEG